MKIAPETPSQPKLLPCTHKKGCGSFLSNTIQNLAYTGLATAAIFRANMISTAHNLSKIAAPIFSATCFGLSSAICSIGIKLVQAPIPSYKNEPNELYSATLQRLFQEEGIEILKNMVAGFTSACTTSALSIAFFNGDDTFEGNETTASYTTAASTTNLLETDSSNETALKIVGSCVIGVGVHLITSEAIRAFITLSNKYHKGNSQSSGCQLPKSEELSIKISL